ncbi:MAG: hypothetical protein AABP62_28750 [Planctomycetota bacterium]
MTKVVLKSEMETQLAGFDEAVEVCDHSGRLMGYFHPVAAGRVSLKDLSPFSDEEIRRRCGESGGRPLADILRDLQQP